MGYTFTIEKHYRVKEDKEYPWPCAFDPSRTMTILQSDILTRSKDGTYMKHTGLGTFGHVLPDADVIECAGPVSLTIQ